jgi:hypothetical protein
MKDYIISGDKVLPFNSVLTQPNLLLCLDPVAADRFCASHLTNRSDKNASKIKSTNNKTLSVSINTQNRSKAKYNETSVPAKELKKLQLATGMSDKSLEITTGMIRGWKSRQFFDTNVFFLY